jgi:hypothetical protein
MSQLTQEEQKTPLPPSECPICTDKYTSSVRKIIECPYCHRDTCISCWKQYLLSSIHDAHCMHCKVTWQEDFLREKFTATWLDKVYIDVEWSRLWEREKSLLPLTQRVIAKENLEREYQKHSNRIWHEVHTLHRILEHFVRPHHNDNLVNAYDHWKQWLAIKDKSLETMPFLSTLDEEDKSLIADMTSKKSNISRSAFVKPCPAPNCRGMLSTQWKCGICSTKVCNKCLAIKRLGKEEEKKEDVHECKEEDLETAKLIQSETKNCPKCGVCIFKIQGCDQMWCTNCNTPFDWKSGQIINGNIHNPHYFEWLQREQGGEITNNRGLQGCQEDTFRHSLLTSIVYFTHWPAALTCLSFMRASNHIADNYIIDLRMRNAVANNIEELNSDLRYQYLKQQLSQDQFRVTSMKRWKKFKMVRAVRQVVEMMRTVGSSILNSIPDNFLKRENRGNMEVKECLDSKKNEVIELMKYYNKHMVQVYERYKSDAMFECFSKVNGHSKTTRHDYKTSTAFY